jgi:hypothetical protein
VDCGLYTIIRSGKQAYSASNWIADNPTLFFPEHIK